MRALYRILFWVLFWLSAPYYFWKMWRRGNWRANFRQRFGRYDGKLKQALTNCHVVWLHAVSVGEVRMLVPLIRAMELKAPNLKLVLSTTTVTGMSELQRKFPSHIQKIYYPLDFSGVVRRALSTLNPEVVVLAEAEIWPNFLWSARHRRIPVVLVNARLSARSFRGYRLFGWIFRPLFHSLAAVGAQDENDAEKLRQLGCRPERIHLMGSMKFDAARVDERRLLDVAALLKQLGMPENAQLLVGGSTHKGEESLLAAAYKNLKARFPDLFLVVVPRHFERGKEVGRALKEQKIRYVYRSQVTAGRVFEPGSVECLLVNTTGELKFFYEAATVIFVGKSLTAKGGQNPIEPGALGKAMVFGPNMQNFESIAAAFVSGNGAVQVQNPAELEKTLGDLLADESRRQRLGANALKVVEQNKGALEKTVDMILAQIPPEAVVLG